MSIGDVMVLVGSWAVGYFVVGPLIALLILWLRPER